MTTPRLKILAFPDQDVILARLEKLEDMFFELREIHDADLNLDFCITSLQSMTASYKRFCQYEEDATSSSLLNIHTHE